MGNSDAFKKAKKEDEKGRIAQLELEIAQLELHRIKTRKIFYDAMDASARSWYKEYARRRKAEGERDVMRFRLKMLLEKPKPKRR